MSIFSIPSPNSKFYSFDNCNSISSFVRISACITSDFFVDSIKFYFEMKYLLVGFYDEIKYLI